MTIYSLDILTFPTWNQTVFPCPVLTLNSWPAYRFLKRQVRWSGIALFLNFPQFIVVHTVKGFDIVNKEERDVYLELSCFFNDPADVGNLISGSSAFSKTSLNIWKFRVHVFLKPGLENFEHYFTSMWDERNCAVVWAFFAIAFLWDWNENCFQSCGHCWVFQICWHIECCTFIASSFRIWNSSTGIPSPPLAFFLVMLSLSHLTSHSKMSGSRWVITPSWLSGSYHFMANRWGNSGNSGWLYFFGLQNHCRWWLQHEIKRRLLLGRKVMTNLDSILKSRHIILSTMVRLVTAMVFPVVMYGCESWTIKKANHWKIDAFELWCWRRLLRVPWTARRSN